MSDSTQKSALGQNESTFTHHEPDLNPPLPKDYSIFIPVVVMAVIFLFIALIAAVLITKGEQKKIIPGQSHPHPTSQLILYKPVSSSA
jgi:hypothetical protein